MFLGASLLKAMALKAHPHTELIRIKQFSRERIAARRWFFYVHGLMTETANDLRISSLDFMDQICCPITRCQIRSRTETLYKIKEENGAVATEIAAERRAKKKLSQHRVSPYRMQNM